MALPPVQHIPQTNMQRESRAAWLIRRLQSRRFPKYVPDWLFPKWRTPHEETGMGALPERPFLGRSPNPRRCKISRSGLAQVSASGSVVGHHQSWPLIEAQRCQSANLHSFAVTGPCWKWPITMASLPGCRTQRRVIWRATQPRPWRPPRQCTRPSLLPATRGTAGPATWTRAWPPVPTSDGR